MDTWAGMIVPNLHSHGVDVGVGVFNAELEEDPGF